LQNQVEVIIRAGRSRDTLYEDLKCLVLELRRDGRPPHEAPHLLVRPPRRLVGVGGEGDRPVARITANRAGLLELREQIDRALATEEGMAAEGRYRETNEAEYDLWVIRAASRKQVGEPREPERLDRSVFA
jgi:hypothetical protein